VGLARGAALADESSASREARDDRDDQGYESAGVLGRLSFLVGLSDDSDARAHRPRAPGRGPVLGTIERVDPWDATRPVPPLPNANEQPAFDRVDPWDPARSYELGASPRQNGLVFDRHDPWVAGPWVAGP